MQTRIVVVDNETGGGEFIKANLRAEDKFICIDLGGLLGSTIKINREEVLAVIETEEHG